VGLLATAAYVISAAAIVPFLSLLAIPVFLVRFFSVSRSFSRYFERLVAHDVTFRLLGNLRTWFYSRLAPLAPARLQDYRGGDLLSRIVRDVEELENVYLRATAPVAIALLTSALTFVLLLLLLRDPGFHHPGLSRGMRRRSAAAGGGALAGFG
jgi:ATP-binding cassette subfamily C protein CydC